MLCRLPQDLCEHEIAAVEGLSLGMVERVAAGLVSRLLRYVHDVTGRLHPQYFQLGAMSGRMACSSPNLQNIPRDPAFRACFCPGPGRALVKADYSQIGLRLAARMSGDTAIQAAFARGEDLHDRTAAEVLGKPAGQVTVEDRQLAKAMAFGLVYGMGADRLREYAEANYGVVLTADAAHRHRAPFFAAYPGAAALASQRTERGGSGALQVPARPWPRTGGEPRPACPAALSVRVPFCA